tara:strand:+ start:514 stop:858 length:345 start_codon:yes stop_codon:yes gene_type:complete
VTRIETPVGLVMRISLVDEADREAEVVDGIGTGIGKGRGLDHEVEVRMRREIGGIEVGVVIGTEIGDVTDPEVGIGIVIVIGSEVIAAAVAAAEESLPGGIRVCWECTICYDRR